MNILDNITSLKDEEIQDTPNIDVTLDSDANVDLVVDIQKDANVDIKVENEIRTEDISPDDLLDKVPANDLKNLIKSAGVELDGNESDDELKGMYKMIPKTEAFIRRVNRLVKLRTEASLSSEAIGGYKIEVILTTSREIKNIDGFCDDIENFVNKLIKKHGIEGNVYEVNYNELHKSMFESECSEDKYKYHNDSLDADVRPAEVKNDESEEILLEEPVAESKRVKRSKFVK